MLAESNGSRLQTSRSRLTGTNMDTAVYCLLSNALAYFKSVCATLESTQIWTRAYQTLVKEEGTFLSSNIFERLLMEFPAYDAARRQLAKDKLAGTPRAVTAYALRRPPALEAVEEVFHPPPVGPSIDPGPTCSLPSDTGMPDVFPFPLSTPYSDSLIPGIFEELLNMDLPDDELLDLATSIPIDLPSSPSPPDSEADSLRELADDPRPLEYDPTLPGWEVGPTTASKKRARQASLSGSINSNTAHTHALSTNVDPMPDRTEGSPGAPPKRVSWRDPIETKLPLQMEPAITCYRTRTCCMIFLIYGSVTIHSQQ